MKASCVILTTVATMATHLALAKPQTMAICGGPVGTDRNTLPAIEYSFARGVTCYEIDVRMSADGEVFLTHDSELSGWTDTKGIVEKMSAAEIRKAKAKKSGRGLTTLGETLDWFKAHPGTLLQIELKCGGYSDDRLDLELKKIAEEIRARQLLDRIVVICWQARPLALLHAIDGAVLTGLIASKADAAVLKTAREAGCRELSITQHALTAAFVAEAHRTGFKVTAHTTSKLTDTIRARQLDVDYTVTEIPFDELAYYRNARDFIEFLPSCKRHYVDNPKLNARDWDRAWTIRDERFNQVTNLFLDIEHPETFPRELFDSASSAGAVRGSYGWGDAAVDKRFAKDVEPCTGPDEKPPKLGVRRAGRDDSNSTDRIRRDFNREQIAELEDEIAGKRPLPKGAEKQVDGPALLVSPNETPFAVLCRRIVAALDDREKRGEDVSSLRKELVDLKSIRFKLAPGSCTPELKACELRRRVMFSDPALSKVGPLAFLARATYAGSRLTNWRNSDATGGHFATQCYAFNTIRGGGLFTVDGWKDAKPFVRNLLDGCVVTNGPLAGKELDFGCFYSFDLVGIAVGGGVVFRKGISVQEVVELGSGMIAAKTSRHTVADRVSTIEAKKPQLKQLAQTAGGKLRVLVFKNERKLEVHAPGWKAPRIYPMTGFSGSLGPKLREGDGQIPEGIYGIEYLNPNSSYYLSLKVSYPNASDRKRAKTDGRTNLGGDIMIHGKNVTIGCIPIGDDAIEDVFYLANAVGLKNIKVIISPYDMRKGRKPELEKSTLPWYGALCSEICEALKSK